MVLGNFTVDSQQPHRLGSYLRERQSARFATTRSAQTSWRERRAVVPRMETTGGGMDTRLDAAAKQVGEQSSRRKMMQTLAALGVGALGLVTLEQGASADKRQQCK